MKLNHFRRCHPAGRGLPLLAFLLLAGFLLPAGVRAASSSPAKPDETGSLFGLTNVWTIHLVLPPEAWAALQPKVPSQPRHPAGPDDGPNPPMEELEFPWSTARVECAGRTLLDVGIRFKGNSSFHGPRAYQKPSFKLDFNHKIKSQSLFGADNLILNNNFNDPAQMREVLAYDLMRRAGLPAPRTAFADVEVSVHGQFERRPLGLYTIVEPINGDFLKRQFGTKKGLLLKPERLAGIEYLGESWPAYTNRYEPKSEASSADARAFIAFARQVNQGSDNNFLPRIKEYLDLNACLRFIAVNALLANVDSFLGNGHNYYLWVEPKIGVVHFLPWDLNEAFGRHPGAGGPREQIELSILHPWSGSNRLVERTLGQTEGLAAYRRACEELLSDPFKPARLHAQIDLIAAVTRPVIAREAQESQLAFERALGIAPPAPKPLVNGHATTLVDVPLKEWISARVESVQEQLAGRRPGTIPQDNRSGPPPGGGRPPR